MLVTLTLCNRSLYSLLYFCSCDRFPYLFCDCSWEGLGWQVNLISERKQLLLTLCLNLSYTIFPLYMAGIKSISTVVLLHSFIPKGCRLNYVPWITSQIGFHFHVLISDQWSVISDQWAVISEQPQSIGYWLFAIVNPRRHFYYLLKQYFGVVYPMMFNTVNLSCHLLNLVCKCTAVYLMTGLWQWKHLEWEWSLQSHQPSCRW